LSAGKTGTWTFSQSAALPEGTHTEEVSAIDKANNAATATGDFAVDATPPVTTKTEDGTMGSNGWFVSDVTVTLSATDNISGVGYTVFSFDDATYYNYTLPVAIPDDGIRNVYYYSADNAGNVETTKSQEIKIDKTKPNTFKQTIDIDNDGFVDSVKLTCTDLTSGCNAMYYTLDGVASTYTCTTGVCETTVAIGSYTHTISFYSVDKAGNAGDTMTQSHTGDHCKNTSGNYEGCPYADLTKVDLHIIDQKKSNACPGGAGSCKFDLAGVNVKIFNRNDPTFQSIYTKNPNGALYAQVYDDARVASAVVGQCTTDSSGECYAGEASKGDFLVLTKWTDTTTGKTITIGRPKGTEDFAGNVATKELQVIKTLMKDGKIEYKGGSKTVVTGSLLEIVYPDQVTWSDSVETYPFIFSSDSNWTVDVCLEVPEGYNIVGIMDVDGNLISTTECTQTFIAGGTKVVLFNVTRTSSPEPNFVAKIDAVRPGITKTKTLDISGTKIETATALQEETKQKAAPSVLPQIQAQDFSIIIIVLAALVVIGLAVIMKTRKNS